jgi:hypothetical protein
MTRATGLLAAVSAISVAAAIWLYLDNRELRARLATPAREPATETAITPPGPDVAPTASGDPWTELAAAAPREASEPAPTLPAEKKESRLERRQRRQAEFAAMFGRLVGETDEEYRSRVVPLITAGLFVPRQRVEEMRKQVEEKAGVTAEQSRQLDEAFDKVYADALDYTNKAIADGILSPYERNVSGWLEYAGGLGGILGDANGQIGQILSPAQVQAIGATGFEWGEYLGAKAPWENLMPPPPPKP